MNNDNKWEEGEQNYKTKVNTILIIELGREIR